MKLFVLASALLAVGCYTDPYYYQPPADAPIIGLPPPALRAEVITAPPFMGATWVGGYWGWGGNQYFWIPGRYMQPPGAGLFWYPGGYVRRSYGWVRVPGRWGRANYIHRYRWSRARVFPPSHPAFRRYGRYGWGGRRWSRSRRYRRRYGNPAYGGRRGYRGGRYRYGGGPYRGSGRRYHDARRRRYGGPGIGRGGGRYRRSAPPASRGGGRSRRAAPRR